MCQESGLALGFGDANQRFEWPTVCLEKTLASDMGLIGDPLRGS